MSELESVSEPVLTPEQAKAYGRVAVLMGGTANERNISLKSGQAVLRALQSSGVDAFGVDVQETPVQALSTLQADRAFVVMHGGAGEDGRISAVLEMMGMPYTGSGALASGLAMDKVRSKWLWQGMQLPTLPFIEVTPQTTFSEIVAVTGAPFVLKPADEGSSYGVKLIADESAFVEALQEVSQVSGYLMAETYASGGEYTVGILGDKALPAIKIETDRAFYDHDAKYVDDQTRFLCPCGLSQAEEQQLHDLSLRAFHGLGCQGWGRIDFMRDNNGQFWLLEANTVPGMSNHSLVPKMAQAMGLSFAALCLAILQQTLVTSDARNVCS